jgi:hypothetical protein
LIRLPNRDPSFTSINTVSISESSPFPSSVIMRRQTYSIFGESKAARFAALFLAKARIKTTGTPTEKTAIRIYEAIWYAACSGVLQSME